MQYFNMGLSRPDMLVLYYKYSEFMANTYMHDMYIVHIKLHIIKWRDVSYYKSVSLHVSVY